MIITMALSGGLAGNVPVRKVSHSLLTPFETSFIMEVSKNYFFFIMLNIKTNKKTTKFQFDTNEIFNHIARSQGVTLTEIVRELYPEWIEAKMNKQPIQNRIVEDLLETKKVRVTRHTKSGRINKYFLNRVSKRVLFNRILGDIKAIVKG